MLKKALSEFKCNTNVIGVIADVSKSADFATITKEVEQFGKPDIFR